MNDKQEIAEIGIADALDRDWLTVAASTLGLTVGVAAITVYSFGVFVRPLTGEFHWSRTGVVAALTIFQCMLALSTPMWGVLIDRAGPRACLLVSVIALSLLLASVALLTPHLWILYLVFGAIPVFAGAAAPIGYSAMIVRTFDRKLGQALGLALVGVGLGAAIIPSLAQWLVQSFGWRQAFGALGGLAFLVGFPAAFVATRNSRWDRPRASVQAISIGALIGTRAFLLMCPTFFLLGLVSVGTLSHLVPMMVDRGFTPAAAARIASLGGLAVVFARGGIGWILDRVHAPFVLAIVSVVAAAGSLLLVYGSGPMSAYICAILVGSTVGAEVDFISFLVRRYFVPAAFSRLYGMAFGFYILGCGAGPLILGASFDRLGGTAPGLLLFAAIALLAGLLSLAMPKYENRRMATST